MYRAPCIVLQRDTCGLNKGLRAVILSHQAQRILPLKICHPNNAFMYSSEVDFTGAQCIAELCMLMHYLTFPLGSSWEIFCDGSNLVLLCLLLFRPISAVQGVRIRCGNSLSFFSFLDEGA